MRSAARDGSIPGEVVLCKVGAKTEHDYVALDAMIVDYLLDAMTGLYEPGGDPDDNLRPERVAASPALLLRAVSGHHRDAGAPGTGHSRPRAPSGVRP